MTPSLQDSRYDILLIQPPIRDFYLTAKRTIPYGLASIAAGLIEAGFSEEEAGSYFAFFYQLQRAYIFINLITAGATCHPLPCFITLNISATASTPLGSG